MQNSSQNVVQTRLKVSANSVVVAKSVNCYKTTFFRIAMLSRGGVGEVGSHMEVRIREFGTPPRILDCNGPDAEYVQFLVEDLIK